MSISRGVIDNIKFWITLIFREHKALPSNTFFFNCFAYSCSFAQDGALLQMSTRVYAVGHIAHIPYSTVPPSVRLGL